MALPVFHSITYVPAEYLEEYKALKQDREEDFAVDASSTPRLSHVL